MLRHKWLVITAAIIVLVISCSKIVYSSTKRYGIKSTFEYTVKAGDTISSIAENYKPKDEKTNSFIIKIQLLNNKDEVVYPGDQLLIPVEE